jgi:hypothetical protein
MAKAHAVRGRRAAGSAPAARRWSDYCVLPPLGEDESCEEPPLEEEPDDDGLDPMDEDAEGDEPDDDGLAPMDDEPEDDGLALEDDPGEDEPAPMDDVEDWPLEASLAFSTSTSACAWAALASFSHRVFCWPSLVSHCALADL